MTYTLSIFAFAGKVRLLEVKSVKDRRELGWIVDTPNSINCFLDHCAAAELYLQLLDLTNHPVSA